MNMDSFADELLKIAYSEALKKGTEVATKNIGKLKWPAILLGGYGAGKTVEQAGKDLALGRNVRHQYEQRGG
jgi:hypothetical protein